MSSPAPGFSRILLEWFATHARTLPWRNIDNPYHVLVSEIILQQTRVAQGMDYYHAFIERFPTVESLAEAPLDAVMKVWQGLGYYTRARNLHAAAKKIVSQHGGQLPASYDELLKLPGLGPYSAGAVASFAFHLPHPAIDGNVYRVLSRVFGVFDSPETSAAKKAFHNLCMEVMDTSQPHTFNQALLDFGATQCVPGMPNCGPCPFRGLCYAEANGVQTALPAKGRAMKMRQRFLHFFMIQHHGKTFIELRQQKDIWHSLYQFPLVETAARMEPEPLFASEAVRELLGHEYTLMHASEEKRQLLSHQELFVRFYIVRPKTLTFHLIENYQAVPIEQVDGYQMPVMMGNYLAAEDAAEYFYSPNDPHQ